MKRLLFLLVFIPLLSIGQPGEINQRGYQSIDKYLFPNDEEFESPRVYNLGKNSIFYYDDNVFRDNGMIATITSTKTPLFRFMFIKSDKTPLSMRVYEQKGFAVNTRQYEKFNTSIKLIFDDNPSTLITIRNDNFFKEFTEINDNDEFIHSLKRYSSVDIMVEYDYRSRTFDFYSNKYNNWSDIKSKKIYDRINLEGSSKALNKIIKGTSTSKKNQFEYIYNMGLSNMNPFDYEGYIYKFIEDAKKNHGLNFDYTKNSIITVSKRLEDNIIAVSLASNDDSSVLIAIDPDSWQKASQRKRWYIMYHELGHDILNLEHGECGPMMNPYAKNDYSWNEFEKDKATMFENYKSLKQN